MAACDPHPERLEYVASEFQTECFPALEEGLEKFRPDVVLVCTPPVYHVTQALEALRARVRTSSSKNLFPIGWMAWRNSEKNLRDAGPWCRWATICGFIRRFKKLKELVDEAVVGKNSLGTGRGREMHA